MSFVLGVAVGAVISRLVMGARAPVAAVAVSPPEAAPAPEPEPPSAPETAAEATPAEAASAEPTPDSQVAEKVDDVVAELERRVRGRRTDIDPERPAGSSGGQRT